jgi:hypothetical protein
MTLSLLARRPRKVAVLVPVADLHARPEASGVHVTRRLVLGAIGFSPTHKRGGTDAETSRRRDQEVSPDAARR